MEKNKRSNRFSPEVRLRAVRMVLEHQQEYASQGAAISAIAPKIGCVGDTLRKWVRQEETDIGLHDGVTSDEREVRELRQANEILRKASVTLGSKRSLTQYYDWRLRVKMRRCGNDRFLRDWFHLLLKARPPQKALTFQ